MKSQLRPPRAQAVKDRREARRRKVTPDGWGTLTASIRSPEDQKEANEYARWRMDAMTNRYVTSKPGQVIPIHIPCYKDPPKRRFFGFW